MTGLPHDAPFGCQMNSYDSERMADLLAETEGAELTDDPNEADIVLFNTCSIREKAQEKVFSDLGYFRTMKAARPELIIGVGGCVASQEGEAIVARAPFVDVVFGPQTLHRLPELIDRRRQTGHSTPCRRRARWVPAPSSPSWKAAASTAASAWCRTPAARKSPAPSRTCCPT